MPPNTEIDKPIESFILAAKRTEHGYIVAQFPSPEINQRTDKRDGSFANRSLLLFTLSMVLATIAAHPQKNRP